MTGKLRAAIEQAVAILGPEAPLCSGCVEEWTEALRILNAALVEQPAIQCTYPLCKTTAGCSGACSKAAPQPAKREPLTPRELELIDGMIEVQLNHAERCDAIANRRIAAKQKEWDMERVELLRKIRAHGIGGGV